VRPDSPVALAIAHEFVKTLAVACSHGKVVSTLLYESTIVTCNGGPDLRDGEMLCAIIEHKEVHTVSTSFLSPWVNDLDQSWLGKLHFLVEDVVHWYEPSLHEHEEWTKVKLIPAGRVEAHFEDCWHNMVHWHPTSSAVVASSRGSLSPDVTAAAAKGRKKGTSNNSDNRDKWTTLIDLTMLRAVPKAVRLISKQHPTESMFVGEHDELVVARRGDMREARH